MALPGVAGGDPSISNSHPQNNRRSDATAFMGDLAAVGQSELPVRPDGSLTANSADLLTETGATSRDTLTRSLVLALAGHGSSTRVMVGVTGFTLNPALRSYLLERSHASEPGQTPPPPQPTSTPVPQRHRLRDRLSEHDLSTLVESFKTGTPAHVLAKRYGVGETALKALLRQRGVRRRRQPSHQNEQQTG